MRRGGLGVPEKAPATAQASSPDLRHGRRDLIDTQEKIVSSNGIAGNAKDAFARLAPMSGGIALLAIVAFVGISRVGCVNLHTPSGHEGYVRSNPFVGAGEFVGTQEGPTSTGWVWRQRLVNIDMRPRTYSEEMQILTRDRLELSFRAHARIRLRDGEVRSVVETFGGENWYNNNVREQFRAAVRERVQALEPFEVKEQYIEIAEGVLSEMTDRYADSPIEFMSVDIGDIQYPQVVVDAVIRKFVTNEENERRDIELQIAQKQIEIREARAQGVSHAQQVIRTTLDPMYLQYEALNAIEQLSGAQNAIFVVAPAGADGAAPVLLNVGGRSYGAGQSGGQR
jgi:hypothetical protein